MRNIKIFFHIHSKNDNAFSVVFEKLQTIEKSYEEDSTITDMLIQKAIYVLDLKEILNELSLEIQLYGRPIFEEDFKLRESLLKELFLAKKIYAEESNLYSELLQKWLDTFFRQNTLEFVFIDLAQASPEFIDELLFVIDNLLLDRRISVSYEKLKKQGTLTKIIEEGKYENDY